MSSRDTPNPKPPSPMSSWGSFTIARTPPPATYKRGTRVWWRTGDRGYKGPFVIERVNYDVVDNGTYGLAHLDGTAVEGAERVFEDDLVLAPMSSSNHPKLSWTGSISGRPRTPPPTTYKRGTRVWWRTGDRSYKGPFVIERVNYDDDNDGTYDLAHPDGTAVEGAKKVFEDDLVPAV